MKPEFLKCMGCGERRPRDESHECAPGKPVEYRLSILERNVSHLSTSVRLGSLALVLIALMPWIAELVRWLAS